MKLAQRQTRGRGISSRRSEIGVCFEVHGEGKANIRSGPCGDIEARPPPRIALVAVLGAWQTMLAGRGPWAVELGDASTWETQMD